MPTSITIKRANFHRAKKVYRSDKCEENKIAQQSASSEYRKSLKNYMSYKRALNKKLRLLRTSNTKEYWNIINGSTKSRCENVAKLKSEVLFEHFKKLNNHNDDKPQHENINYQDKNVYNNDILDKEITLSEIHTIGKKLKSGKSPGCDGVLNEFLKKSIPKMGDAFVGLFNLVLVTGYIPEEWSIGLIVPIYKKK